MSEVQPQLCNGHGGAFPAYHSISGSDNEIAKENTESKLDGSIDLDKAIEKTSGTNELEHITKTIHYHDALFYIYTSGTTGCPT